jgi:hypothetical protein
VGIRGKNKLGLPYLTEAIRYSPTEAVRDPEEEYFNALKTRQTSQLEVHGTEDETCPPQESSRK